MQELVDHGFDVTLTSVSAEGLGGEWLGTRLNLNALDRLRALAENHRFNIDGEGGEFETAVLGAPWMDGRIEMDASHHSRGARHWLEIEQADLV
jgi:diphthamide synthase (EF-2-diphthine--ammonia ligase)